MEQEQLSIKKKKYKEIVGWLTKNDIPSMVELDLTLVQSRNCVQQFECPLIPLTLVKG